MNRIIEPEMKNERLNNRIDTIIRVFFVIISAFIVFSICFLLRIPHALHVVYKPNIILAIVGIILIAIGASLTVCLKNIRNGILFLISGIFLFLQIFSVRQYFFDSGWDIHNMYMAAMSEITDSFESDFAQEVVRKYFLMYPNNLLLVFIFKTLLSVAYSLGMSDLNAYFFLLVIQCIISWISGLLLFCIAETITEDRIKAWISYSLYILFIGLSPWVSIPYSDSMGIIFPLLILFVYLKNKESEKDFYCLLIGFLTYFGYRIKPQIALVTISLIFIEIIRHLNEKMIEKLVRGVVFFLLGMAVSFGSVKLVCNSLKLEKDPEQAVGIAHYVAMGLNQETMGVYSSDDVEYARSFRTKAERNTAEWNIAKERIRSLGILGVLTHFVRKTLTTYSDGMFGWGQAGSFFRLIYDAPNETIAPKIRSLYYLDGRFYKYFSNYSQAMWLGILALSVCSCFNKKKHYNISVVMLSLIGLFIFESLFEAGSRYLYIYLPFYIILASEGAMNLIHWICPSRMLSQKSMLS